MSSSPITLATATTTAPSPGLLGVLEVMADPRDPRGRRHRLPGLIGAAVAAVLSGACSFVAIGEWVADQTEDILTALGITGPTPPSESTIRRTLARLNADTLDRLIGVATWTRTRFVGSRRVIAVDGKTLRGARAANSAAPHLVAALDHACGAVVAQIAVATKSNEIPAVRDPPRSSDLRRIVVGDSCPITGDPGKWVACRVGVGGGRSTDRAERTTQPPVRDGPLLRRCVASVEEWLGECPCG